jgi:hypothetical protein
MSLIGHEVIKMAHESIKFRELSLPLKVSVVFSYITGGYIIILMLIGLIIGMYESFIGV